MEATCQRCAHTHTHAGDCGHTHDQQGTGFLILSFLLLVGGVILRYLQLPFWMIPGVEVLWFLLAFLPVGFPVMVEVWKSIRQKDIFNEFSLMLLATIGAFWIKPRKEAASRFISLLSCGMEASRLAKVLVNTDLPEPDSPTMAMDSPS